MVELIKLSGDAVTLKIVTAKSPSVNGTDQPDGKGMLLLNITEAVKCSYSETRLGARERPRDRLSGRVKEGPRQDGERR